MAIGAAFGDLANVFGADILGRSSGGAGKKQDSRKMRCAYFYANAGRSRKRRSVLPDEFDFDALR